ncbi:hypothetical protein BH24ACI3_BH24ACI3_17090 [soil metagenome]
MIIHVLPGDSLTKEFTKAEIDGNVVIFREALIAGDVSAEHLDEFWDLRANFVALEYGEDPIDYREKVAYEIEKLIDLPPDAEVHLWFEYELFCQVNMWFCLDILTGRENIYRVAPVNASPDDIWKGFGDHDAAALMEAHNDRAKFSADDIAYGSKLWKAFKLRDSDWLLELGGYRSACYPFLEEVCAAAAEIESRPAEILREIKSSGQKEFEAIFAEFQKRAGVYGFGDLQVARLLDRL